MARLLKLMAGSCYSAAAAVWKRPCSSSAAWKRTRTSPFHTAAAAAAWNRPWPPSPGLLLPRRPVTRRFTPHGVFGDNPFTRNMSTEDKNCWCLETLPDSKIEGFMYDDYDPPESINWCKLGVATPVRDQVIDGPCWAYAATEAIESINAIRTKKLVKLSVQQIIDCNYLGNDGYYGGNAHMAFDYVVRNGGLVEDSVYPSVGKQCPCRKISSHMVTIDGYQFVPRNEQALMKAVANQPVVADIRMYDTLLGYKGGIAYDAGECGDLNHSVLVVTYGATSKGEKFWVAMDSFGTKSRKRGFIYIARDTGRIGGAFGIAEFACFPVKTSQNCEGFVDDDISLYDKIYGGGRLD